MGVFYLAFIECVGLELFAFWVFMIICCQLFFFKINFFKNNFQEYHQSVKQFGSRSGPSFVRPDLDPNCLSVAGKELNLNETIFLSK